MATHVTLTVREVSHSVFNNTSQVEIIFSLTTEGATYNEVGDTSGYVELNGKRIADLAGKRFSKNTTTTLYSGCHTVAHNADGTKTVTVNAGFDLNTSSFRWLYADKKLTLTTIPRASSVAAANFTIGTATTIHINRASSGFYHALRYSIGLASGAITNGKISGNTVAWTPPESLATQLPDTVSREVDIICETYSGSNLVGTTHNKATLSVPESYRPTIQSVTLTPVNTNTWLAQQGIYVERYSKCRVKTSAVAGRGSSIGEITIAGIGTGRGADWTSGYLLGGDKTVSVTAYDRRPGRKAAASQVISVYSYAAPAISAVEVFRCDADGKVQEDGTYLHVACTVEVTSLGGRNALTLQMRTRPSNGMWGGYTELTNGAVRIVPGFSAQKSYEVELVATDSLGETKAIVYTVPTAEVAFHLRPGGKGVAMGKYSEKEGAFECQFAPLFYSAYVIDDLNKATATGWYLANNAKNAPEGYGGWMTTTAYQADILVQDYYTATTPAYHLTRQCINGAWGVWEWVTPPMKIGVEYRTTEKYLDKPVYVMVVDMGHLPNNSFVWKRLVSGARPIRVTGVMSNSTTIPGHDPATGKTVELSCYDERVWIKTNHDYSAMTAIATVWYTKITD